MAPGLLVIGTTTPEIKPGGIPSFIQEVKSLPRYRDAVFLEWGAHEDGRQLSLGRFNRGLLMRTLVSQIQRSEIWMNGGSPLTTRPNNISRKLKNHCLIRSDKVKAGKRAGSHGLTTKRSTVPTVDNPPSTP